MSTESKNNLKNFCIVFMAMLLTLLFISTVTCKKITVDYTNPDEVVISTWDGRNYISNREGDISSLYFSNKVGLSAKKPIKGEIRDRVNVSFSSDSYYTEIINPNITNIYLRDFSLNLKPKGYFFLILFSILLALAIITVNLEIKKAKKRKNN